MFVIAIPKIPEILLFADGAKIAVGEVLADGTGMYALLGLQYGGGKGLGLTLGQTKDMEGKALGALLAHSGQGGEGIYKRFKTGRKKTLTKKTF